VVVVEIKDAHHNLSIVADRESATRLRLFSGEVHRYISLNPLVAMRRAARD
jgi:hypothetical protein